MSAQPQAPAAVGEGGKQALVKKEFVKSHAGLTTVPVKVMVMGDLEALDLSHNAIEVIPKGLFPDIRLLKTCDLSNNSIKALPDDVAALKDLDSLILHHNCLSVLPSSLYSLTALVTLDVSYNRLAHLQHEIGNMQSLQVLNLSGNRLRSLPADIGWLALKQLNVADNPDLHTPVHVLQKGLRAVMSYLQVVGEQHHQLENHMAAFTSRLTELQAKHNMLLPGAVEDEGAVLLRVKLAQRLGMLSCSQCNLAALPAAFTAHDEALADVQVVDVCFNKLRSCPQDLLGCINNLVVLNLSYNRLSNWPAAMHMPALAILNLSFNNLELLPDDIGQQMPALQQLYLANNYLTSLPDSLALVQLCDLFLSENDLQVVPQVLCRCTALVKLSLAACRLAGLCQELAGMSHLRFLDVGFNQLTSLSPELSNLEGLSTLNLSYNALGTFPDVISYMTSLRELNLDSTGIAVFPRGLGKLRQLEGLQADGCPLTAPYASIYAKNPVLLVALHDSAQLSVDLSDCSLEAVPADLLLQTQLTSLNLSKNNIQELPAGLGQLRRLRQLVLKGNPLHQPFARLIDARGELAVLALLRPEGAAGILDLSACGIEDLPTIAWQLPGRASALLELQLTNNRLRTLPQGLSALVTLTRLVVDSNLLRELPEVVLGLPSLAVLQASSNSITHLPDDLYKMESLQALMVSGNQLRQLPASIGAMSKLRALSVASNRLWQLPDSICGCSMLRLLDCSHNPLATLPQGISQLTNLRSLKLTHNRLTSLPVEDLLSIKCLEELHAAGNAFSVEGDDHLNATGWPGVQQLLHRIAAAGHGTLPSTRSQRRSSLACEVSWNAGVASAVFEQGGQHAARRSSNSSIGGRSPSPQGGCSAQQDAQPQELLSSLKHVRARSTSPFGRRDRQHPASVTWGQDAAAAASPEAADVEMARAASAEIAADRAADAQPIALQPGPLSGTLAPTSTTASKDSTVNEQSACGSNSAAGSTTAPADAAGSGAPQPQATGSTCSCIPQAGTLPEVIVTARCIDDVPTISIGSAQPATPKASMQQPDPQPQPNAHKPAAEVPSGQAEAEARPDDSQAAKQAEHHFIVQHTGTAASQVAAGSEVDEGHQQGPQPGDTLLASSSREVPTSSDGRAGTEGYAADISSPTASARYAAPAPSATPDAGVPHNGACAAQASAEAIEGQDRPDRQQQLTARAKLSHQQQASQQPAMVAGRAVQAVEGAAAGGSEAAAGTTIQEARASVTAKGSTAKEVQPVPLQTPQQAPPTAPGQLQHPKAAASTNLSLEPPDKEQAKEHALSASAGSLPAAAGSDAGVSLLGSDLGCSSNITTSSCSSAPAGKIRAKSCGSGLATLMQGMDAPSSLISWDKVPLMEIPRVVRACVEAPSPPAVALTTGQCVSMQPARPQTRARFKRVMQQSATALVLLEYGMQQASQQQQQPTDSVS